jgi:hypothetical protein
LSAQVSFGSVERGFVEIKLAQGGARGSADVKRNRQSLTPMFSHAASLVETVGMGLDTKTTGRAAELEPAFI